MAVAFLIAPLAVLAASDTNRTESSEATEENVQDEVADKLAARRKTMIEEAHSALDETNAALAALDAGNPSEALDALARVTGKLELIVARDPALALAPVDVDYVTHDLYATPQSIRKARDRAAELLEEGRVQEARALLAGLGSEVVIRVTNLPLATYPDAIKEISPLIDEGKIEEAKTSLQAALNTLVVTDRVIPLPILRARHALAEAEALSRKEESTAEEQARIAEMIERAREQLEVAELLGYGTEDQYVTLRKEIRQLEARIRGDEDPKGLFARLRESLEGLQESFFE